MNMIRNYAYFMANPAKIFGFRGNTAMDNIFNFMIDQKFPIFCRPNKMVKQTIIIIHRYSDVI